MRHVSSWGTEVWEDLDVSMKMEGTWNRNRGRDLLASMSFSNLLFSTNVAYWTSLSNRYYFQGRERDGLWSCLAIIAIWSCLTYATVRLARKCSWSTRFLVVLGALGTAWVANRLRIAIGLGLPHSIAIWVIGAAILILLAYQAAFRTRQTASAMLKGYLLASSFLPMSLGTIAWRLISDSTPAAPEAPTSARSRPIIIWAVFDELDEKWLFEHRIADLRMPNFDFLRACSTVFENALRPGPETLLSLPALTTGRAVSNVQVIGQNDVLIDFADGGKSRWSVADSVFDDMNRLGRASAIDGYYHNYRGVFSGKVSDVQAWPAAEWGFWATLEFQLWLQLPNEARRSWTRWLCPHSIWNVASSSQHRQMLQQQLAAMDQTILSRTKDFLFLHCRVPHGPWIYDYKSKRWGFVASDDDGYFGNMAVADMVLGEIVADLRRSGQWENATLLVTADHNMRGSVRGAPLNHLVPLILKLPGQTVPVREPRAVRAIDERSLITAIASGTVRTPEQAVDLMLSAAAKNGNAR